MSSPKFLGGPASPPACRCEAPLRSAERKIVHRVLALAIVPVLVLGASAQQPRKASPGPRALGVLVMPKAPAGAKKPPQSFLIPIALWYQNRYFDAQVYEARPQPMALEGGVVYEIRRGGEALGLFTIDSIAQQENKKWLGGGKYQTMKDIEARAAARREREKPPSDVVKGDGPPRLLRRQGSSSPASAPSEPAPSTTPAPTTSAPTSTPTSKTEPAPEKKPEAAPAPKAPATSSDDDDPDRPKLHRAPGGEAQSIAPAIKTPPATLSLPAKNASEPAGPAPLDKAAPAGPAPDVYVAISDVKTTPSHSYDFEWSADEKETFTKAAMQAANAAVTDFLQRRYHVQPATPAAPKAAPRSRTRATAPAAPAVEPLDDVQIRALDVETNSYPQIIFSARRAAQVPGPDGGSEPRNVFVTVVLRVDTMAVDKRDQYRNLLTSVTDDRHMDEQPRLELIDTIDTDGDGIGKLLFREVFSPSDERNPEAWGFAFYRVGTDRLEKLYDTEGKIE